MPYYTFFYFLGCETRAKKIIYKKEFFYAKAFTWKMTLHLGRKGEVMTIDWKAGPLDCVSVRIPPFSSINSVNNKNLHYGCTSSGQQKKLFCFCLISEAAHRSNLPRMLMSTGEKGWKLRKSAVSPPKSAAESAVRPSQSAGNASITALCALSIFELHDFYFHCFAGALFAVGWRIELAGKIDEYCGNSQFSVDDRICDRNLYCVSLICCFKWILRMLYNFASWSWVAWGVL